MLESTISQIQIPRPHVLRPRQACIQRKDVEHGVKVAKRIGTGMVFVNHPTWTKADLPLGGVGISGYGHELANMGIQDFVNKKLIKHRPDRHSRLISAPDVAGERSSARAAAWPRTSAWNNFRCGTSDRRAWRHLA
jgi:hypothetical protein